MTNDVAFWRRMVRVFGRFLLGYLIFELIAVVVFRSRWQPAIDSVRRFNKKILNPAMMKLAGKRHWYAAVVRHTGRKSGKDYATPVWAEKVGRSFFIPLPYGTDVDWCRNILAAGSCVLEDHGARYHTTAPVIVPAKEVAPQLPARPRRTFGLFGVDSYLRLDIEPIEEPEVIAG